MQLFVKVQETEEVLCLDVEASNTIKYVKTLIQDKTNVDPRDQRLWHVAYELQNGRTLSDHNIREAPPFPLEMERILRGKERQDMMRDWRRWKRDGIWRDQGGATKKAKIQDKKGNTTTQASASSSGL